MLVVAALGGNALLRRGEPLTAENQRANVRQAARALAMSDAAERIADTTGGKIAAAKAATGILSAQMRDLLQFVVIRHDVGLRIVSG